MTKLLLFGIAFIALPTFMNAQPIDVDNRTGCDFEIFLNTSSSTTGCPMGSGPLVLCPAGVKTTIIAAPPPTMTVTAYGCEPAGAGITPIIVARPGCGPGTVTTTWCGTTTFEYRGRLLVIR